jgi:hypothetical protein
VDNIPNLLKAFVIAGGVALVAGSVLLVVLILRGRGEDRVVQELPVTISLPRGARVERLAVDGDRWLLLGTAGDGRQFLAVVDPQSGAPARLLWLQPED